MKTRYWFILFIVFVVLAYLAGSVTGTPFSKATPGPAQEATTSETSESQGAIFETVTATPELTDMLVNRWTSTSPDGQWLAEGVMAFHKTVNCCQMYYTGLILQSADSKKQWTIIDEWAEEGLGMLYLEPVRWSKDGRSFYYTHRPQPEGCGGGPFFNGNDLHKVDLDSGTVLEVFSGFWIAISPDEATVAYIGRSGLVLRDLASGQEREVSIDPGKDYYGKVVWSPDGKFLALTLAIGACSTVEDGESTSILLVDAETLQTQTVLSEDKRFLVAEEWAQAGQVVLVDPPGNRWIWNVESKTLESVSP